MNYIILEIQTTNGTTSVLNVIKTDYNTAEQEYHSRLSFAAVSSVDIHSVTMLTERGKMVKYECYVHTQPQEEE